MAHQNQWCAIEAGRKPEGRPVGRPPRLLALALRSGFQGKWILSLAGTILALSQACAQVPIGSVPTTTAHEAVDPYRSLAAVHPNPENRLDLVLGRPSLLTLKEPPLQIRVADEQIVAYQAGTRSAREISLVGRRQGTTILQFVFGDPEDVSKQSVVRYAVYVQVDPEPRAGAMTGPARGQTFTPTPVSIPSSYQQPTGPELYQDQTLAPGNQFFPASADQTGNASGPRPLAPVPSSPLVQVPPATGQAPRTAPAEETGPAPRKLDQPRLQGLPGARLNAVPQPDPETLRRINRYLGIADTRPDMTLDIILGQTRLLKLIEVPFRVQVGNDKVLTYNLLFAKAPLAAQDTKPTELALQGESVGQTTLNLWFGDPVDSNKQTVISFLVSVIPDPGAKERLERVYKALEDEINRYFPDAWVHLFLVGDKLVVSGEVKDVNEAVKILQVIRAAAPGGAAGRNPAANIPISPYGALFNAEGQAAVGLENYILQGETNIVNLLRIPGEQQVLLKVTVAEVSRAAARSMGINFQIQNGAGTTVFGQNTGALSTAATATASAAGNVANIANIPIALDNGKISLQIQALRNVNLARTLAEPNLTALNGHVAKFQAGGEFPVPVVAAGATGQSATGINFVPFGVQLSFTPYVTDKDRIRLELNATVSVRDNNAGASVGTGAVGNTFIPGLNTRTFSTTVEMREGQTMAVAGLLQTNLGGDTTRIPGLGDIPLGGQFFRTDHTSYSESELVILVTPELVHPMEPREIPPLPGSDYFEPDDLQFYLRGRLENTRTYDYRSPVMHDIDRMRAYRNCEIQYMLGPVGYTDEQPAQQPQIIGH